MRSTFRNFFTRLWVPGMIFAAAGAWISLKKFWSLEADGLNLGYYSHLLWNLNHGVIQGDLATMIAKNLPPFWPLAAIFVVFPRAETLLVFQSVCLSFGALAVFFLANQYLTHRRASTWVFPFFYWIALGLIQPDLPLFDPTAWALPLFLWGIVGLQSATPSNRWLGSISFAMALASGLPAVEVALPVGLMWLLGAGPLVSSPFTKKFGLVVSIMSLGLVLFHVDWINTIHTFEILAGGIFVLWGIPVLLRKRSFTSPKWMCVPVVILTVGVWVRLLSHSVIEPSEHALWLRSQVLPCLNFETSLAVPEGLFPHLATRPWIEYVPNVQSSEETVECAVMDPGISNAPMSDAQWKSWAEGLSELGFHEAWSCRDLKVFERGMAGCLTCIPRCV